MGRWSGWLPIDLAATTSGPLAASYGIYQIRAVSRPKKPIRIPRLGGYDQRGLMYIGRSGHRVKSPNRTLARRLQEFLGQHHSGGITYAKALAVLRRARRYSKHLLEVRVMELTDRTINASEVEQLRRYFRSYAELPPCNSSLPRLEVISKMKIN